MLLLKKGAVVDRTVGGAAVFRAVVERGLARMGTRCPGKRVGARVMVVRRVLILLGVLEEAAPPAEGVAGDAVEVVVVVVSMALGKELGLERKKGSWPIPLESTRSVGTYSLTEPTTIHLRSMRLSPRPMKPMNRGTTHSHVCCRFHTMQSLQRNSRGGSAAPSPPPSGPPPAAAAAAAAAVPSSAEAAAAEAAPGGEAAAAPSLILGAGLHLRPPEGRARGMGPRGPGAGAGSGGGGGGFGRRQRPRRPHANRLPAPTPLPPRGGRRAGRRGAGEGTRAGEGAARSAEEGRDGPPAPPAGQGAAGRVCSPPSGLLRAGAPRLLLLLVLLLLLLLPPLPLLLLPLPLPPLPAACKRSSRAGILGAPRPARSPWRPPAPPLGLEPRSRAEPAGRGIPGAGEPHSDTGGRPGRRRRRSPGPARRVLRRLLREPGRQGAPVLQPARSQPSASTLWERPIRAQRGGRAAGLASLPPPATPRRRRRPRVKLQRAAPSPPRARGRGRTGRPRRVL